MCKWAVVEGGWVIEPLKNTEKNGSLSNDPKHYSLDTYESSILIESWRIKWKGYILDIFLKTKFSF